jgi:pimeloyl-ACP methyl ester carboxylesterase
MMTPDRTVETVAGPFSIVTYNGTSAPVLAIPGATSTNRLWLWLHDAAPWATLLAPDLPGRGLTPPRERESSVAAHADDLVALLDASDLETVDVVGMSMGGFIAVELAARHPGRVRSLTLLDGGLPVPTPMPAEAVAARFRAQADTTDWPDAATFARAVGPVGTPLVDAEDPRYVAMCAHDLTRGEAGGAVRTDTETVVQDAVTVLASERPAAAFAEVTVPVRLLHAEWAIGAGTPPMYPAEHVAAYPQLTRALFLDGADHAATVMTDRGAAAGAELLAEAMNR